MSKLPVLVALAMGLAGCAARAPNLPPVVPDGIEKRTGHPVRPLEQRPDGTLPAGVNLSDGVTEEEAVAVALWNNAKLAADLAGLGVARADLIEAATWRNPTLQMLFPIGLKPFELAVSYPLEILLAAAETDGCRAQAVGPAGRVAGPERPRHGPGRPAGAGGAGAGAGARARGA